MNRNIKLLVESIFNDNKDIFNSEKEYLDDMYNIISDNLYKYHPKTKKELQIIIRDLFSQGIRDLNCIDVSQITDFSNLFYVIKNHENRNFDVSKWNVGNGINFSGMFEECKRFNCDLSKWNVSNGTNFSGMFWYCEKFNSDLSGWDVSNGADFGGMFFYCKKFNGDLSHWNVSNGTDFNYMFCSCEQFNCDLSHWNVGTGTDFSCMFDGCKSNKIMTGLKKIKYTINFLL